MFGGYNPDYDESGGSDNEDYPLFRELWKYHFATGSWEQIRTEGYMPTELASMSGCISNGFEYSDSDLILNLFASYTQNKIQFSVKCVEFGVSVFLQLFCTATTS